MIDRLILLTSCVNQGLSFQLPPGTRFRNMARAEFKRGDSANQIPLFLVKRCQIQLNAMISPLTYAIFSSNNVALLTIVIG